MSPLRALLQAERRVFTRATLLAALAGLSTIAQAGCLALALRAQIAHQSWWPWVFALAMLWLARTALLYRQKTLLLGASARIRARLRAELLDALARLGPRRRDFGNDGALAALILQGSDALDGYVSRYVVQQRLVVLMPLFILIAVFPLSPLAALLFVLTAPMVPLFMILVGRAAADKNRAQLQSLAQLGGRFLDFLRGMPTLKRLDATTKAGRILQNSGERYRKTTLSVLALAFLSTAVLELISALAIALVAVYLGLGLLGVLPWDLGHIPVPYPQALFILLLAPEFYQPLRQLGADYHDQARAKAALENLAPLRQAAAEIALGRAQPLHTAPEVRAEHVHIVMAERTRLKPLSFQIPAGTRVAVMGASGSGKSTLLHALLGFVPYAGQLAIDDQSPSPALATELAFLAQQPPLLAGSIADNLRHAAPEASRAQLIAVLQQVGLWDALAARVQDPLALMLGEGGRGLSGGQCQRLALAQLVLRQSPLWLLDEPTAHLDPESGREILTLLETLSRGKTVLIATHAIVPWVDTTLLLENPSCS